MATRVNMLKLLQEVDGHANFTSRRPQTKASGLVMLPFRSFNSRAAKAQKKRVLTVLMRDFPDIPAPVAIKFLPPISPVAPSQPL